MLLEPGTVLQNGRYRIIRTLGQGGFGITYEAEQAVLHRRVAIKEFFMKEYCERDEATRHVTLGATSGSKDLVARFRSKFLREAQMIAGLEHPHIVKIHDVFEENGTAYYVMEYLDGESLSDRIRKTGPLSEAEALKYIRQIGNALSYLHGRNCLHFDVKPSNILVKKSGDAVLIDFGVSKHYDAAGSQTSSTPVGISKGYAPLEQYQQNEISTFTPATDIYALGATLYTLLTGEIPPSASEVNEDGVPPMPGKISKTVRDAIEKAMSPRRKDRPQSVEAFLDRLGSPGQSTKHNVAKEKEEDATVVGRDHTTDTGRTKDAVKEVSRPSTKRKKPAKSKIPIWCGCALLVAVLAWGVSRIGKPVRTRNFTYDYPAVLEGSPERIVLHLKNGNDIEMVKVEAGSFEMGATPEQGEYTEADELPVQMINIDNDFWIATTEVPQRLWSLVMGSNPSSQGGQNRPVDNVSYDDCMEFLEALNTYMAPIVFHLPSENEWEYAARGGHLSAGYRYSGSDDLKDVAWYIINSNDASHNVGMLKPNELGIYDMSGNVLEWVNDRYSDNYDSWRDSEKFVMRGGCWDFFPENCRVASRFSAASDYFDRRTGLRLIAYRLEDIL